MFSRQHCTPGSVAKSAGQNESDAVVATHSVFPVSLCVGAPVMVTIAQGIN